VSYVLAILDMNEFGVNNMPHAWRLREDVALEDIVELIKTYNALTALLDVIDLPK
jgi:hypothetical protein